MPVTRLPRAIPLLALGLAACGPADSTSEADSGASPVLPLFVAADEPSLDIGVLEGPDELMLDQVVDVLRLDDGSIAVSDAQAALVSVFSAEGEPIREWGGRGDGPGEFRSLSRIYPWSGDSLLALDARGARASVLDLEGNYAREIPAVELSGDSLFSMDVWLHGRFVVDGVMATAERDRVRRVLDGLPSPRDPAFRWVRVDRQGRLWMQEAGDSPAGHTRWVVLSPEGDPLRIVDLPDRLDADELGFDEVLGRYLGTSDVNLVRAYPLVDAETTLPVPSWLWEPAPPATDVRPPEDFDAALRGAIKQAASAQEMNYARHFSYTTISDSLDIELEEGVELHFFVADDRGWAGVVLHPAYDRLCGLGYGGATPPGWRGGYVTCGR